MLIIRLGCFVVGMATLVAAAEPLRLWVDANGVHSVRARLVDIQDDQSVVLLRKDGTSIEVAWDNLSRKDQRYIFQKQRQGFARRPKPVIVGKDDPPLPQPLLDLPAATESAMEGSALQRLDAVPLTSNVASPQSLPPDPALWMLSAISARIPTQSVDLYSRCSHPLGVIVEGEDRQPRTLIAVSISDDGTLAGDVATPSWEQANRIVKFDIDRHRGEVVFRTPESIRLLDHHIESGRSLVHIGFDSLGRGGQLAMVSDWQKREVTLDHRRQIDDTDQSIPAHLTWAAWIDEEHVLAKVDETLYLWNLVSGQQLYAFTGLDERAVPAISGGRRYVALPGRGVVDVMTTFDGKSFGRISIDSSDPPCVAFSPHGDQLAIASRHRLDIYDLTKASLEGSIESRRSLGDEPPIWVGSNFVLASSGVLISRQLRLAVWRYDLTASEPTALGEHVVALRRHPHAELTISSIPHPAALDAMRWIRPGSTDDPSDWNLLGRSVWGADGWVDQDVKVSSKKSSVR